MVKSILTSMMCTTAAAVTPTGCCLLYTAPVYLYTVLYCTVYNKNRFSADHLCAFSLRCVSVCLSVFWRVCVCVLATRYYCSECVCVCVCKSWRMISDFLLLHFYCYLPCTCISTLTDWIHRHTSWLLPNNHYYCRLPLCLWKVAIPL